MNLKDKFKQADKESILTQTLSVKCVVIADEFAIGLGEWKDKYCIYYDGWNIRIPLGYKYSDRGYSNKELLEIYKKEKEL